MSSTALAEAQETAPVVAQESANIMQVIGRAAADPNTDVDKLERLLVMYERLEANKAKAAYAAALAELQPELPVIEERGVIRNRQGEVQSTYALWEDVNEAIKPVMQRHGFAISFRTATDANSITVTGVLSHRAGHSEETAITLPADTSGSKNAVQAVASSVSYGKRYTSGALLNYTSTGEDDDGQAAGAPETISEKQLADIEALMTEVGADRAKFMAYLNKWLRIDSLSDIPASHYAGVIKALEAKRK